MASQTQSPVAGDDRAPKPFCLAAERTEDSPLPLKHQYSIATDDAPAPVDRRTSTSGLSVAVREVRIRLARNDIYDALCPVSCHAEAALLCIEAADDDGLEHHLRRVVDDVRKAAQKHKELRALLAEPGLVRQ
jgi:hypothetical protein